MMGAKDLVRIMLSLKRQQPYSVQAMASHECAWAGRNYFVPSGQRGLIESCKPATVDNYILTVIWGHELRFSENFKIKKDEGLNALMLKKNYQRVQS